jgi:hypothetical protein
MSFIGGSILIAAGVGALTAGITTGISASAAKKREEKEAQRAAELDSQLASMEANRPEFKNPYEGLTNQYENLNNPYAGLTVATAAAEMQSEQSDIALANALDVMLETGGGAGGATALAQAALQSKKGVSASIQAQEAQNKKLAAQGEAQTAKMKAQGAQQVMMLKAKGDAMEQQAAINWHDAQLNRTAGLLDNANQNQADAEMARTQAIVTGVGAVGSEVSGAVSQYPFGG